MNPFELTKDQYGSITVRVKSECVVLTREEARRIEERFIGISGENAKLREVAAWMYRLMDESCAVQHPYAPEPIRYDTLMDVYEKLRELGIEVSE